MDWCYWYLPYNTEIIDVPVIGDLMDQYRKSWQKIKDPRRNERIFQVCNHPGIVCLSVIVDQSSYFWLNGKKNTGIGYSQIVTTRVECVSRRMETDYKEEQEGILSCTRTKSQLLVTKDPSNFEVWPRHFVSLRVVWLKIVPLSVFDLWGYFDSFFEFKMNTLVCHNKVVVLPRLRYKHLM